MVTSAVPIMPNGKALPQPVTLFGAGCNTTRDLFRSGEECPSWCTCGVHDSHCGGTGHRYLAAVAMLDVPGSSLSKQLSSMEDNSDHERHDEANALPWFMVMEALAVLHSDMDKLKEGRRSSPSCGADDAAAPDDDDVQPDSVLLQCTRAYGPVDEVSAGIDKHVADMVNHVFDSGLREEYKEILDDVATKRSDNCHALAPVDCNSQVLDALKTDAKKADFHMKDVSKDIIKAARIWTKFLTVLDKIAQTGQPEVAHEVGMFNGALSLLGNAYHKNNLARQFIIKHEINQKYAHLCSDKVPMTLLFGDDVSLSAKHIEDV
ncbi:hypothetical protein E2C01_055376 [Portunus trituberculatus]|uniref:Uncharacterized protein n=1 Tax=Portunus trituberculatus TaxID=210409 RepID=A0A5B7GUL7_PORTR|nr:hypothetical protein [Portunus trituberculatus]